MDAFSAVNSFTNTNPLVSDYIYSQQENFRNNVSSNTWEMFEQQQDILRLQSPSLTTDQIERLHINQRNVLDPYAIERMTTPYLLQTSNEHNQPLTMAHPTLSRMHKLGQIEGYGLDQDDTLAYLLQKRIVSGTSSSSETQYRHNEYIDDANELIMYNHLSALERRVIQANQRSALDTILDDMDFSSLYNGGF